MEKDDLKRLLAGLSMDNWGIDFAYFVTATTVFVGAAGAALLIGKGEREVNESHITGHADAREAGNGVGME